MRSIIIGGAVLAAFLSNIPYILDILRGKTKPNIATWSTWLIISAIAAAAAYASDAYSAALLALVDLPGLALVVWLGIKRGTRRYTRFDIFCQVLAVSGIVLWQLMDSPAAALTCVAIADVFALLPTLRHSYFHPKEETWLTYVIFGLASLVIALSSEHHTYAELLIPSQIVLLNVILVSTILVRKHRLKKVP